MSIAPFCILSFSNRVLYVYRGNNCNSNFNKNIALVLLNLYRTIAAHVSSAYCAFLKFDFIFLFDQNIMCAE